MIEHYPYKDLGHHDLGWLDAHYHFSFADYLNRNRMGFGALRVINDDVIMAGAGFDTHPHKDMEIITYVRKGAITHRDSRGNKGRTEAGSVQVMSAGTGVYHSEFNFESEDTTLFQIWIKPKYEGVKPQWKAMHFPEGKIKKTLPLLVSGFEEDKQDGVLHIHQDARIYGGIIGEGQTLEHPITNQAYFLVSDGEVMVDGQRLTKGDGAEITKVRVVTVEAIKSSEILIIDVPQ